MKNILIIILVGLVSVCFAEKYAIVKDAKVINIIEADATNAANIASGMGAAAIQSNTAGIGQIYNSDGTFSPAASVPNSDSSSLHQSSKPLKLQQAENVYLSVAAQVPGYVAGDTASVISVKLQAAVNAGTITQTTALQIGLQLLGSIHDVEVNGGSWQDLPLIPHVITSSP